MKNFSYKALFLTLIIGLFVAISPSSAQAAIDDMDGYWNFDDGDVVGQINQAQPFSNSGSGFDTGDSFNSDEFTLSTWIKTTDSDRGDIILGFDYLTDPISFPGFGLILNPQVIFGGCGDDSLGLWTGGSSYICANSAGVDNDEWHLVTATFDGAMGKIYIDGNEEASESVTPNLTHATNVILGHNPYGEADGDAYFEGALDDVRIYDRALSEEEVAELYAYPPEVVISTSTVSVITIVINDNGGTAVASDFTITVTAENPSVLSFSGSTDPFEVVFDAGEYTITGSASSSYALTASEECEGDLPAGESADCTITYDDIVVTPPGDDEDTDEEEATTTPEISDEENDSNSNRRSGGTRRITPVASVIALQSPAIAPEQSKMLCTTIDESLRLGSTGKEVSDLQELLNKFIDAGLSITGLFDAFTREAVNAFQLKYANDILAPWGVSEPSGNVSFTTMKKLNELSCKIEFPLTSVQLYLMETYKNKPAVAPESPAPSEPAIEVGTEDTIVPETQSANVFDASNGIIDKVSEFLKNIF